MISSVLKGLPNWAVGLFGGLGVLVVGLGVFSVALRARDEGAESAKVRTQRPPRLPATAERTMPTAVVEQIAVPAGSRAPTAENAEPTKPDLRGDGLRPVRPRKSARVPGSPSEGAQADSDNEAAPPATTPSQAAPAERQSADPEPESESPSLAEAEKMQQQMEAVLASLGPKIEECARAADVTGEVEVRVAVSQDGSVKASRLLGDFDGTPAAACIQSLVAQTHYQRFKGASIKLSHRFSVE